ncbi:MULTISPECIES: DNA-processing protein DprA [unclassified Nitratiruptor]|uniref:DNA-processing protein DprA n=1 Tax=unclassified Nitratiruptor TaxID=2624044 RepID=UPI0019153BEC|nr:MULTISPECIES: DNA-processing protein DprA [unclassified Nitratiruptor]BCD60120.1 DNA processing protein [Nitratiruptor sp. YY08-10]BCD64391.1 DNA processing protein [Nitratiruptor sp. YY08-14]
MVEIEGVKHYYKGNLHLLQRPKISIVGTRRPNSYTKAKTIQLAAALTQKGYVVVSGAAMGVDALAHKGAGFSNTIAVVATGLDIRYPAVNAGLIEKIEKEGLILSQFDYGKRATKWSFIVRNETVVALGESLIITQADRNSGSMRSAEIAQKLGKKIYVLPHRMGESEGTNDLIKEGLAEVIWDIDQFVGKGKSDPFIEYLKTNPSYEEALHRYGEKIFEAEIQGLIAIHNLQIIYKGA